MFGTGDKIALIGSAPSSIHKAPYPDTSWNIWGCSPGAFGQVPRSDVWFELHRWEPPTHGYPNEPAVPWFSPEYTEFLKDHPCVVTSIPIEAIKNHYVLPYEELRGKYGDYFWTSSIAWMLAMAIEQKPKAIGLWGIDMAAGEEYHAQRPGCQHFIGIAQSLGIDVILPPESDLMRPPPPYGVIEYNPRFIKMLARKQELERRIATSNQYIQEHSGQAQFLNGAVDDLDYMINTYSHEGNDDMRFAIGHAQNANPGISVHGKAIEIGTAVDVTDVDTSIPNGVYKIVNGEYTLVGEVE